jgi:STAM-binding protein
MSVTDITEQAENFEYDPKIRLRHWLRSADTMQKEACRNRRLMFVNSF